MLTKIKTLLAKLFFLLVIAFGVSVYLGLQSTTSRTAEKETPKSSSKINWDIDSPSERRARFAKSLTEFQEANRSWSMIVSSAILDSGELVVEVPDSEWDFKNREGKMAVANRIYQSWAKHGGKDFAIINSSGQEVGGRGFSGVWVK